jgi:hypothetical protein
MMEDSAAAETQGVAGYFSAASGKVAPAGSFKAQPGTPQSAAHEIEVGFFGKTRAVCDKGKIEIPWPLPDRAAA